jgi:hypothetical protein
MRARRSPLKTAKNQEENKLFAVPINSGIVTTLKRFGVCSLKTGIGISGRRKNLPVKNSYRR